MKNSTNSTKYSKKGIFLKALEQARGNRSEACRIVNIDRKTFYNWIHKDPEFERNVNDTLNIVDESIMDFAVDKLREQVEAGNITAIIYTLKTKGKKRGYSTEPDNGLDEKLYDGVEFVNEPDSQAV